MFIIIYFFINSLTIFYRIELCSFSGYKIYPGHGKKVVKVDGRVIIYVTKPTMWFPNRSVINQPVQSQKIARILKCRFKVEEELYYPRRRSSEE